jgi:hypothetical protein
LWRTYSNSTDWGECIADVQRICLLFHDTSFPDSNNNQVSQTTPAKIVRRVTCAHL